ncbi:hypothetical protein SAY87_003604 [Trapa incisa]|uniref:phosphoethanolamine N-methyltransferase n=1 Tax=Trapa incisa TaxID=236973 RepID=A0AAN7KG10_9MYRT|nr:hypothetical protein SAY87_003604 [Trapa incisa]
MVDMPPTNIPCRVNYATKSAHRFALYRIKLKECARCYLPVYPMKNRNLHGHAAERKIIQQLSITPRSLNAIKLAPSLFYLSPSLESVTLASNFGFVFYLESPHFYYQMDPQGDEREVQKSYWIEHSADHTVEAMMLDSKAADLDKEERPEPGGKVLISDYCRSPGTPSPDFAGYIKQRGYDLHEVKVYSQVYRSFANLLPYVHCLSHIPSSPNSYFSHMLWHLRCSGTLGSMRWLQQDYDDIISGWKAKLVRSSSGEQRWGLFIAKKN